MDGCQVKILDCSDPCAKISYAQCVLYELYLISEVPLKLYGTM